MKNLTVVTPQDRETAINVVINDLVVVKDNQRAASRREHVRAMLDAAAEAKTPVTVRDCVCEYSKKNDLDWHLNGNVFKDVLRITNVYLTKAPANLRAPFRPAAGERGRNPAWMTRKAIQKPIVCENDKPTLDPAVIKALNTILSSTGDMLDAKTLAALATKDGAVVGAAWVKFYNNAVDECEEVKSSQEDIITSRVNAAMEGIVLRISALENSRETA